MVALEDALRPPDPVLLEAGQVDALPAPGLLRDLGSANGTYLRPPGTEQDLQGQVRARFDVSRYGRVRNIATQAEDTEDGASLATFRRRLAATLFRPRWDTGEAQATEGVERDYHLRKR